MKNTEVKISIRTLVYTLIFLMFYLSLPQISRAAFVIEQTLDDCFATSGTGNTMTSWSPQADEILLLAVTVREETTAVSNVAGNGLTWTEVRDVDNARGQNGTTVFRASSASTPSSGSITFDHNSSLPAHAVAVRVSGGDISTNNGVEADNGSGGTGSDDADMTVNITTVTDNALAIALGGQRGSAAFSPDTDETEAFESSADCGSGGNRVRSVVWYKTDPITPIGTVTLGKTGNWDGSVPWAVISLSLKQAGGGGGGSATLEQVGYKWFANDNSTNVGRGAQINTPIRAPAQGTPFRLRLLLHVAGAELGASGTTTDLQFAVRTGSTCGDESFTDIATGSGDIRFYNNSTPADGDNLTANNRDPKHVVSGSVDTVVNQDYEESNTFTNSVAAIPSGQDGMWDFALQDFSAPANTTYCFRAAQSGGGVLEGGYSVYPEITTAQRVVVRLNSTVRMRKVRLF